jgi:hypothetical protein
MPPYNHASRLQLSCYKNSVARLDQLSGHHERCRRLHQRLLCCSPAVGCRSQPVAAPVAPSKLDSFCYGLRGPWKAQGMLRLRRVLSRS